MALFYTYIFYFFIYSFFGWICESIYCSIGRRKLINRGFLNGPLCPIYGFGALFVILMLSQYSENLFLLFIYAMIGTSVLEYCTSIALESVLNTKLWDYSHKFCNLNGRICLKNSVLFGFMSLILMKFIHPTIKGVVELIPIEVIYCVTIFLLIFIIIELTSTINSFNKLCKKLESLGEVKCELENIDVKLEKFDNEELNIIMEQIECSDNNIKKRLEEINNKLSKIKSINKIQKRLFNAFPNMKHKKYHEQLQHLKNIFKERSK